MANVIGDPRPAGAEGPAGDQRKAGDDGPAGDPRPAGEAGAQAPQAEPPRLRAVAAKPSTED